MVMTTPLIRFCVATALHKHSGWSTYLPRFCERGFQGQLPIEASERTNQARAAQRRAFQHGLPDRTELHVVGHDPLDRINLGAPGPARATQSMWSMPTPHGARNRDSPCCALSPSQKTAALLAKWRDKIMPRNGTALNIIPTAYDSSTDSSVVHKHGFSVVSALLRVTGMARPKHSLAVEQTLRAVGRKGVR